MSYTREDLINDVTKEAQALRVHATKEERERLNFAELNPEHINKCIYGQMTGSCNSERGAALIYLCACRFIKDASLTDIQHDGFERIQRKINGNTVVNFIKNRTEDLYVTHYSAIEAYILLPDAKNANLISYLKGETETLDL